MNEFLKRCIYEIVVLFLLTLFCTYTRGMPFFFLKLKKLCLDTTEIYDERGEGYLAVGSQNSTVSI